MDQFVPDELGRLIEDGTLFQPKHIVSWLADEVVRATGMLGDPRNVRREESFYYEMLEVNPVPLSRATKLLDLGSKRWNVDYMFLVVELTKFASQLVETRYDRELGEEARYRREHGIQ